MQNNFPVNVDNVIPDLVRRPNGFLLNLTDFIFLDLPISLALFVLGYFLFRLTFNYRISLLFRPYALIGYFFFVILDGKIEIDTFYFLSELQLLICTYFGQKWQITVMIYYYFGILFFSTASMFLYQFMYKKVSKHLFENCKLIGLPSIIYMSYSIGLYNVVLGFAHRLLINYPN